jgi:uncharacterized C2H2 Zn-finger protein
VIGFRRASLLNLVARGENRSLLEKAVLLLLAARPELDRSSAWDWTLGDRDRTIWDAWRHHHGGGRMDALSRCPRCDASVEFCLPDDFSPPPAVSVSASLKVDGQQWRLRLPTSRDMLAAQRGDFRLPDLLVEGPTLETISQPAIEAALEAADPGLDVVIALGCPTCDARWEQSFDVIRWVWQYCEARADRLLQDIDAIARAYGWSEADILALSEQRHRRYVAMINAASNPSDRHADAGRRRVG